MNVAARLEGKAGESEIVLSQDAIDQLETRDQFKALGGIELKNIAEPVLVAAVVLVDTVLG